MTRQRDRCAVAGCLRVLRAHQNVVVAGIERTVGVVLIDVVPEGERGKPIVVLPGGVERRCLTVAAVEAEFSIGDLERAIP